MIKNLPWILSTVLALVIIAMIVFKEEPPPIPVDVEAERREKERIILIQKLEQDNKVLISSMQDTILFYAKKDSASRRAIARLNRRLKDINTSKATSKELDSLIQVLYGQ